MYYYLFKVSSIEHRIVFFFKKIKITHFPKENNFTEFFDGMRRKYPQFSFVSLSPLPETHFVLILFAFIRFCFRHSANIFFKKAENFAEIIKRAFLSNSRIEQALTPVDSSFVLTMVS